MLWACGFRPVGHVLASHVNDGAAATELEVYVLQDVPLYLRGQSVRLAVADWPEPTGSNRLYRIGGLRR